MKRFVLLAAALVVVTLAQAQRHVEFKWHRWYGVGGYEFVTNFNTTEWNDKAVFNGVYAIGGWQIRKESGIGVGVEYLHDGSGAFSNLPVFVELRSHYLRNQLTPFTAVQVGYAIPLGSSSGGADAISIQKGGVVWGINAGARYALPPAFAVFSSLAVSAFVGYQEIYFAGVVRQEDGILATTRPLLLRNIKAGVAINF